MSGDLLIFDFDTKNSGRWQIINDGVMGGLSQSRFKLDGNGYAIFSGNVSLENNGGFASVRTQIENMDLSDYDGALIRVKGDGKKYNLRFRTDENFDGPS